MTPARARLRHAAAALLLGLCALLPQLARACTGGGCVMAGPRLASVSSSQGALLNALVGSLLNSNVSVNVLDWNALAGGNVSLLSTINALQTTLGVSTPAAALNTPITLGQLTGAISTAASQAGNTSLAASLGTVGAALSVPGTIKLGDLITSDGIVGTTQINALSLVDGAVQLYNSKNVATTPNPIDVTGAQLGQSSLANISVQVQAVEPPVYVCGPVGTTFHSSALRVKLGLTLASLSLSTSLLQPVLGNNVSLTLATFSVYIEVAHASGVISAVNAITNAMSVQATPGIASVYLGTFNDLNFFDRTHTINPATDLTPGTIAQLVVAGSTIGVYASAAVTGTTPSPATVSFSGAGVQSQTITTSGLTATTLLTSLASNLTLSISPSLGVLDSTVLPLLKTIISGVVAPVLQVTLPAIVDPLLSLVGIRIGEVDITSGGTYLVCAVSGCVYADANHNVRQDSGETGTLTTLYAKLVNAAAPTVVQAVATVDPTSGNYSFPTLNPGTYSVVISTSNATTVVTAAAPAGWIGTESPTLVRAITIGTADLVNQRFGLFHGSSLAGTVFKDNGAGGGTANNGVKDGSETGIGGTLVSLVDAGATLVDSARSDPTGAYQLWIPYTTTGVLKVSQAADPLTLFVAGKPGTTAGAFTLASAVTSFTHVIGSVYTGVDFGDVPINRLDTDGQQAVAAGTTALFPHVFHAGSAGQLTLAVAPTSTAPAGWSATTWLDANCNGQLDSGETELSGALSVVADQNVCVIVKVFVPQTAANETRLAYTLTAGFAYANSSATAQATRQDLTLVGTSDGLRLVKAVDVASAISGQVVTYTVTYLNQGAQPVSALKIRDATPAWTVMNAASCGSLPSGITCSVSAQPAVGAAGSVEWTLTGSLPSGASGTVTFSVKVQ